MAPTRVMASLILVIVTERIKQNKTKKNETITFHFQGMPYYFQKSSSIVSLQGNTTKGAAVKIAKKRAKFPYIKVDIKVYALITYYCNKHLIFISSFKNIACLYEILVILDPGDIPKHPDHDIEYNRRYGAIDDHLAHGLFVFLNQLIINHWNVDLIHVAKNNAGHSRHYAFETDFEHVDFAPVSSPVGHHFFVQEKNDGHCNAQVY